MKRLCLLMLALACAACQGAQLSGAAIPTLAQLPTLTETPLPSATLTPSRTPYPTWTPTATFTLTRTPSPTATAAPTEESTPTPTVTPSLTITPTPTHTPTPEPPPTSAAAGLDALAGLALQATVLPISTSGAVVAAQPTAAPTDPPVMPTCAQPPSGGFALLYYADAGLASRLGCPTSAPQVVVTAYQMFESGSMLYLGGAPGTIYVLFSAGDFDRYVDSWQPGVDPESGGETPPLGFIEPVRGFGKIWRTVSDVRPGIGWAITIETGNESRIQAFERGWLIYLPQVNRTLALFDDPGGATGQWRLLIGGA